MRVSVTTLGDDIYTLEVSDDMELENFKALCEMECNIPASEMTLLLNGRPLQDDKMSLEQYGVHDGDVLIAQRMQGSRGRAQPAPQHPQGSGQIDFGAISIPALGASGASSTSRGDANTEDPAVLRDMLLKNPHDVAILKERNPALAEALLSGNLEKFSKVLRKQQEERQEQQRKRIRMLNADPFDSEAQRLIAEEIRLENVEANMQAAMEFSPESFGQVAMLYVDCVVNGYPVKAFIDSGAQMTIMSQACAERCHIMRLVDTRWAGIAKGVGTQKIIGRIHVCQIQIGNDFLQSSFSVLENQQMDMLLGLDMLKRHQCCIDLKRNVLVIGTTGTVTSFLTESELPEFARLNRNPSETIAEDEDGALAQALARSAEEAAGGQSPSRSHTSAGQQSSAGHRLGTSSSASTSATSPATRQQQQQAASRFPERDVARLVGYGFSRHRVLEELTHANGNVDQALAALFAQSFVVPK